MGLESVFTRIYAALDSELSGYTLTSDEKAALVRVVLESELAEYLGAMTDSVTVTFSFRETEAVHFRRKDNATFDDRLSLTAAGTVCVVETAALDFSDKQLMAAKLSKDAETGCTPTIDLCVDADPDDDEAGSFLVADEGHAALAWDTEIPLDIYPTDYLVLQLTLPSNSTGGLRAVRLRLTMLSKALTNKQIWAVGKLAARRHYQKLENYALKGGGDPQTVANWQRKIKDLGAEARGLMAGVGGGVAAGGLGGPVNNAHVPVNPYRDR